ncbi:hypothetical protein [Acidovorax sp. SUPP3334]
MTESGFQGVEAAVIFGVVAPRARPTPWFPSSTWRSTACSSSRSCGSR